LRRHHSRTSTGGRRHRIGDPPGVESSEAHPILPIVDNIIALFHRLKVAGEALYSDWELSAGMRGILRSLDFLGPHTVPQLARMRTVSRQHIQSLVNPMIKSGFIELMDNPHHKRSPLLSLTQSGKEIVDEINRRENEFAGRLKLGIRKADLKVAAGVLAALKESFDSGEMMDAVEQVMSGVKR